MTDSETLTGIIDRLNVIEIKLKDITDRVLESEKKLSEITRAYGQGRKAISDTKEPKEFDNFQGASFRKLPGRRHENTAYCESCKVALFAHKDTDLLVCPECGKHPGFNKLELLAFHF